MLNIHKKKAMVSLNATSRKGFTFVELVVVIAVLAVLLAVLAPSLLSYVELSRMQKDDSTMDEVVNAVQLAITDSATFDEVYSYCIPNNYVTYTDSSGKYANRTMDEEFWAPDGSGAAVTITFNPENGKYKISEGIVNDMTFGNGSVAEKRTAEGVQQCYLYEMGQSLLFSSVKQTIGDSIRERSATYKNSSYTVFIRFKIVDGTRQADVYGLFNGTNLSEGCPAAIGSNTSSYDEENKPISTTPSGGHQNSSFTNTDLSGSGSLGGFGPNKPLPTYRQCKNGHTFDETNPVLAERCICTVCYATEHKFHETGTILRCQRCGYRKEHVCTGNPCKQCGSIPFTITVENREKIGYTGDEGEHLIIPIEFTDTDGKIYRITGSSWNAFLNCTGLKSVDLQANITPLYFFGGSTNLETVTLPDGIQLLGLQWFMNCSSLKNINIPDSVTSINNWTFRGCSSLESIHIPNGVISIGEYAFESCNIQKFTLPNGLTNIGNGAFKNCRSLTSINIPDGVTSISNSAFQGCSSLTSINIPDNVTSIGSSAFQGCSSLTSINIPDSVTSIGDYAFSGCSSLTSINIPDSVTSIGDYAFSGCSSLTSINIPDGVTSISSSAFRGCSSLTSINIPDSVTSIGNSAFQDCCSLSSVSIPDSLTNIGDYAFLGCSNLSGSVNIPDGVSHISQSAFSGCTKLSSITLPTTLASIGNNAFWNCPAKITIPNNVSSIGSSAFQKCVGLTGNVIIPSGITTINALSFCECKNIESITIPFGVTSIERLAFAHCLGMTEIVIPDSVTTIGDSAFQDCQKLSSIIFQGTQEKWNTITKGSNWDNRVGTSYIRNYTVHCTDGNIVMS